jgi:hypothetical protein
VQCGPGSPETSIAATAGTSPHKCANKDCEAGINSSDIEQLKTPALPYMPIQKRKRKKRTTKK